MKSLLENWFSATQLIVGVVTVLWCVALTDHITIMEFSQFGIYPRELAGLAGIVFWVLLHADFTHIAVNTTPLLFLGFFVALRGPALFCKISVTVWFVSGFAVWLLGRDAIHLGASGLIFGYFGFLLAIAIYERRIFDLAVASLVIFYYGGLFLGILPFEQYISWESHLFGLFAGILAARLYGREWHGAPGKQVNR